MMIICKRLIHPENHCNRPADQMIICKRPVHQDDHLHSLLVVVCHWSLFDICFCLLLVIICCLSFVVVYRLSLFVFCRFLLDTQTTKILQKGGGGLPKLLQYYIGGRGLSGPPKSDYVICARPLSIVAHTYH